MLLSKRRHRLQKSQDKRYRKHEIDQYSQEKRPATKPLSFRTREEYEGQKAVAHDHNEDQSQSCLKNFDDAPCAVTEYREPYQHGNRGHGHLREYGHRER